MLKNYAIRTQLVNTKSSKNHECPTRPLIQSEDVAEIATVTAYWAKRAAIGTIAIYGARKVIDTASEVALIIARNNFK